MNSDHYSTVGKTFAKTVAEDHSEGCSCILWTWIP